MAKKKSTAGTATAASAQAVPVVVEESSAALSDAATAGDNTTNATIEEDEEEEELMELLQVELGDIVKIKQVLDEAVVNTLLEQIGLPENYSWDNFKLSLMTIACIFAIVAQFAPLEPFNDPNSRLILGICICFYFVLSGILQFIITFIDQDSILWTVPLNKAPPTSKKATASEDDETKKEKRLFQNTDLKTKGLQVRTSLPRFSEYYTVTIQFAKDSSGVRRAVSEKWSIGQFFDKEGYFDEIGLTMEIEKSFDRFDRGKYDDDTTEDKKD